VWSVLASVAVVVLAVYLPLTQDAFATVSLTPRQLAAAVGLATVPLLLVEAAKAVRRRASPVLD